MLTPSVDEIKKVVREDKDKLDELFQLQDDFQTEFKNFPFRDEQHRQEFINLNTLCCTDELFEGLRETRWKNPNYIRGGWKTTQTLNQEHYKEELVDVWHFLINLSIAAGMDSKDLHKRFLKKNKINHQRQSDGY